MRRERKRGREILAENGPRHRERAQPPGRGSATEKGLRHGEEKTATEQGLIHRRGPQPPGKDSAAGRGPIHRGGKLTHTVKRHPP